MIRNGPSIHYPETPALFFSRPEDRFFSRKELNETYTTIGARKEVQPARQGLVSQIAATPSL